jgi:acetyltransferase-like isoleucine patch superfamily enzyme
MKNRRQIISRNTVENLLLFLAGLPKTIWFNFRYFRFVDAIKLPVFVSNRVWLMRLGGSVKLGVVKPGVVKIGFGDVGIFDRQRARSIWQVSGSVEFKGVAKIGHGSKISVVGELSVGNNVSITAESALVSHKRIIIGDDVLISWDVLVMDSDLHDIFDNNGLKINQPMAVVIGNKVWIGCRSLILKGVTIADGVVVAANSTLTKSVTLEHAIVGGNPVRVIRKNISWSARPQEPACKSDHAFTGEVI